MRLGIRKCHLDTCPGANGIVNEMVECRSIISYLIPLLINYGHDVIDYTPANGPNNSEADCRAGAKIINAANDIKKVDVCIAVHANAYFNEAANGTEAWIYSNNSNTAKTIATRICNNYSSAGFNNRGVKIEPLYFDLKFPSPEAIILENFFVTSPKDVELYRALGPEKLARLIANAIDPNIPTEKEEIKEDFNDEWYAKMNPDVVNAGMDLYYHYKTFGKKEGRTPVPTLPVDWDEGLYLMANQDINKNVSKGGFVNGAAHWLAIGWKENRKLR